MEPVQQWTGRTACALQAALRMTNESFAAHLGTAVRTVATWHQKPDRVPSTEIQQALDTTLERAGEGTRTRFTRNVAETGASPKPTTSPCEGLADAAGEETTSATDRARSGTARNAGGTSGASSTPIARFWAIWPPSCIRRSSASPERQSSPRLAGCRTVR